MSKSLIYRLPLVLAVVLFASTPAYAGGGGWFIKPLGLMLGGAMILTILLTRLKQTNILSFVIMGYIMASVAGLPETSLDQLDQHYSGIRAILSGFQQIGLVLILFMAGLQFNLIDITKRFKLILVNGVGYLGLGLLLFLQEQKALVKASILPFALLSLPASWLLLLWKIVGLKNHCKDRFQQVLQ